MAEQRIEQAQAGITQVGAAMGAPIVADLADGIVHIARPEPNAIKIVDITAAKELVFDFSLADARVSVLDVDVVLIFPDGGKVILPGFALALVTLSAPPVAALEGPVDGQQFLALVGDTKVADQLPTLRLTDLEQQSPKTDTPSHDPNAAGVGPGEADPAPPPAPIKISTMPPIELEGRYTEESQVEIHVLKTEAYTSYEAPRPSSPPATDTHKSDAPEVPPAPPIIVVDSAVDTLLYGNASSRSQQNGPVTTIHGGFADIDATTDKSYDAQIKQEQLNGTQSSDVIYADDFAKAPPGSTLRAVDLTVTPNTEGAISTSITISGLPDGMSVVGASPTADGYRLAMASSDPNHIRFDVVYALPAADAIPDGSGLYGTFALTFVFDTIDENQRVGRFSATQQFAIGKVTSNETTYLVDGATNQTIVVLSDTPPGTVVNASGGDDTIYAALGPDAVNGGAGIDMVSYRYSTSGVTVDMAGTNVGGYAQGDALVDVENIEGSRHSDFIIGTAGDNLLRGGEGFNYLDGGAGRDTADYSTSDSGVLAILAGTGVPGTAVSTNGSITDELHNIENLGGSAHDDTLRGDAGANVLMGNGGNDSLAGGGGADTLDGGDGTDFVDYSALTTKAVVDLSTGADAAGETFISIEGIKGSKVGDELTGDDNANTIFGNEGDDVIEGGGGADTLDGGSGTKDILSYEHSLAAVTISLTTGATANAGDDAFGDSFVGFEGIRGTGGNDQLTGNGSDNELLEHEKELQQIAGRISDLSSNIPQTESAIVELGRRQNEARLQFRTDADKERADAELQIAKLEESVSAMTDRATRSEVAAPISGTVNKLFASTLGGTVKSGEPLAQIVPTDASIEVEARLSPTDRAEVWPGLPAVVKISAYDYSIYGGLKGKVTEISSDALQDERGEPYFRIRIEAHATDFGPDHPVVPGMIADVDILSGRQSIMASLLRPAKILRDNALRL